MLNNFLYYSDFSLLDTVIIINLFLLFKNMIEHIIIVAIFFMFYIIGNIIAFTAQESKYNLYFIMY